MPRGSIQLGPWAEGYNSWPPHRAEWLGADQSRGATDQSREIWGSEQGDMGIRAGRDRGGGEALEEQGGGEALLWHGQWRPLAPLHSTQHSMGGGSRVCLRQD